jgi:hypothetical protein
LENRKFDKFSPNLLGLDNITLPSKQVEALAAVFDLSGFTNFCSQVDPHLAVPEYLSRFLDWLFDAIKSELTIRDYKEGKILWTQLPFLAKFMGDGVLFLWDTSNLTENCICNIVGILHEICQHYRDIFYTDIKKRVVNPPSVLRCGIARGIVFSVGNGDDYVGPCINIAERLQKLSLLTFCFTRRGFDVKRNMDKSWWPKFIEKKVPLRGIGNNELVWIIKEEFDKLPLEEKKLFKRP